MTFAKRRGSRWYAIRHIRKPDGKPGKQWIALPRDIKGKRDAENFIRTLSESWDREKLGLRPASSRKSGVQWDEVAAEVIADKASTAFWLSALKRWAGEFSSAMGARPMSLITTEECRQWVRNEVSSGVNTSTLRKKMSFVASVFRRAVEMGVIERSPWTGIKRPAEPAPRNRYLSRDEFDKLIAVSGPRAFRWRFLVATGARLSEARSLTFAAIDFTNRQIALTNARKGKAGKMPEFRTIPLPQAIIAELRALKGKPADLIFPGFWNWRRDLMHDAKLAKIEGVTGPHVLRKTFASWLAQAGVPMQSIAALLGHTLVETTQAYAYLAPNHHRGLEQVFEDGSRKVAEVVELATGTDGKPAKTLVRPSGFEPKTSCSGGKSERVGLLKNPSGRGVLSHHTERKTIEKAEKR